jgi:DNA-binding MarR family transcriptional regulator
MIDLVCACATVRRTARLVTQLYSREIANGLEPAQFSLLTMLSRKPGTTQASIGRALGMDKTTASRSLLLMRKNAWIEPFLTDDHRERGYRLTPAGKKLLAAAKPGWQRAQRKLRANLKPDEWDAILEVLNQVAEAAVNANALVRSRPPGRPSKPATVRRRTAEPRRER